MRRTGKITAAVLAFCLICAGFSSCGFVVTDVEGLLKPPTLNKRQAEVYNALGSILNTDDVTYRFPQRGDWRSPFLFYDLDGDGLEEAIVFYSFNFDPANTRAKILRQNSEGAWTPVHDSSVSSSQIDFVQFSRLLSDTSSCMLVGWQAPQSQSQRTSGRFLSVYSLKGDDVTTEVASHAYIDYAIKDFDGNGVEEMVTVGWSENRTFQLSLLRSTGRSIAVTDAVELCSDTDVLLQMVTGKLWAGAGAVYIDQVRTDSTVATEVFRVDGGGLSVMAGGDPPGLFDEINSAWENYTYTFRDDMTFSGDVDGDGTVEVPAYSSALPGNLGVGEENPVKLTQLMQMTPDGFDVFYKAVINQAEGYLLLFPEKWLDKVAVARYADTDEWKFFLIDAETGEPTVELLRIQAYTVGAGGAADAEEIPLGSRGIRRFTGYIPRTGDAASITETELRELFKILP